MPDSLFGGGSTDSNGAPVNIPINAIAPPYVKNTTPMAIPNMPGQIPLLARDLQAGGFAPQTAAGHKSIVDWLNKIYQPAQSYRIGAPKPTTKPTTKPKTPVVPPVSPSGYITGYNPDGTSQYGTYMGGRNSR